MKELNPSIIQHLVVGLLMALWIFAFAFIIKPFDDGTLNFRSWLLMSFGFSVVAFLCYSVLAFLQKSIYKKISKWNFSLEIGSIVFFFLIYLWNLCLL